MQPGEQSWTREIALGPALALFLIAPVLGELVSAYQAPLEFLNPLRLAITLVPYGCGALAARELLVRRRRGWASLVLLGLAFGLIFEGLVTRVIFNPNWEELGALSGYGRAYGVNWILAVGIVHFQAAVSIVSAVLLAEMLYPQRRDRAWLGTPALIGCCVALPGWALVLGIFVPYVPPLAAALGLVGLAGALIGLALTVPARPFIVRQRPAPPPRVFGLVGGAGMTFIMIGTYVLPEWASRPPAALVFTGLLVATCAEFAALTYLNGAGAAWTDRHRLALVAGFLAFFLTFGIAQDFTTFAGRSLVSLATIWLLRRLWVAIGRRQQEG
jgi:hypothetical protein